MRRLRSLRGLSLVGGVVGAFLTVVVFLQFPPFTLLAAGVTVGCLLYAVMGHQTKAVEYGRQESVTRPELPGVLTTAFLLANAVAILSLSTAYYNKPILYFIAIAIAAGILVLRVAMTNAHASSGVLACVYGLNTFVSNQLAFPLGLNGPDIGDHVGLAQTIVETSQVTGGGLYNGFPAMHLLTATASLFTGGSVVPTYRTLALTGMVLALLVTYLVARKLGSRRYAVMAIVVLGSMEYVVYRAGHPSKLAFALPLVVLLFATVVYLYETPQPGMVVLFGLFSTALVFTHAHTAAVTMVMLVALGVGQFVLLPLRRRIDRWSCGVDPSMTADGGTRLRAPGRGHVLAVLFVVAFVGQFLYFSQFFTGFLQIGRQYVDVLLLTGGPDPVESTPRFNTIPTEVLLVNTIGSGTLAMLAILGGLNHLRRRKTVSILLFGWLGVAGALMIGGVFLNLPFALPNRVYVIVEMTGLGLFGAAGLVYLLQRAEGDRGRGRNVAVVLVVGVVVGFALFSTASTIAGLETSPFNEDVGHRTWYGMVEEDAGEEYLVGGGVSPDYATGEFRWARSLPVGDDRRIDYDAATNDTLVGLNDHKMTSGVVASGGKGRIGTGVYVIPEEPRSGLSDASTLYDNGAVEVYRNRTPA